jgi:4-hydroxy-3-methylbut-2-enyl diphosphate reductase IspH
MKPPLRVVLCAPRGFCAGVVRAIETVERALQLHGAPVYVGHEIVHDEHVLDSLKAKGVIFIEELDNARDIITALKRRFPSIYVPLVEDICYATTNRQDAVKAATRDVEAFIVVGASNSPKSQRLREVAEREGCAAQLVADALETLTTARESMAFPLPQGLRPAA